MTSAAIKLHHRLEAEDQARADFYALLSRLFADAPDAALLQAIAAAPALGEEVAIDVDNPDAATGDEDDTQSLTATWDTLRAASGAMDAEAASEEYNTLFVGVGKSEVNLHASHCLTGFMMEKPLVELRATLTTLGLGRRAGVTLLEDHLAAVCETMRILIAGQEERKPASIEQQRMFFERHLEPWAFSCCSAIEKCVVANYYRRVAQFAHCYLALERDSLAIE
ncbi:MAG: molecular chaperone TorD family protein [Betaproteobacteria bacterium]